MKVLQEFLNKFNLSLEDLNLSKANVKKHSKEYYLVSEKLTAIIDKIDEFPVHEGFFLGKIVNKNFVPSPYILNLIKDKTNNYLVLNEKSSWLFICGRDIFSEGIIKNNNPKAKLFLVLNERDEVLGLCKKDKNQFKNLFDIGIFQRTKR